MFPCHFLIFCKTWSELFCALYSPPHPSPRNGFEEKLASSAAYILTLSHLHCAAQQKVHVHISGCTGTRSKSSATPTWRKDIFRLRDTRSAAHICRVVCSREHIKSQQGLRLWLAGLSRYPPTLKRSKDETLAQSRLHQASIICIKPWQPLRNKKRGGLTGLLGLD